MTADKERRKMGKKCLRVEDFWKRSRMATEAYGIASLADSLSASLLRAATLQ